MHAQVKLRRRWVSIGTSHKGVSCSVCVYDVILVDVQDWKHGHPVTYGSGNMVAVN